MAERLQDVFVVAATRTPVSRCRGSLAAVRPDDLAALVLRAAVERAGIDPAVVDDVQMGAANQAGEDNRNVARMALLLAGFPTSVPGTTVNRLCGSSLEAVNSAFHAIRSGEGDVVVAGGVESMTRAPWVVPKPDRAFAGSSQTMYDTTIGWRMTHPALAALYHPYSMGETAENLAERYAIGQEEQDAFSLESHRRAVVAQDAGAFAEELVPVPVAARSGTTGCGGRASPARQHARTAPPIEARVSCRRHRDRRQQLGHQRWRGSTGPDVGAGCQGSWCRAAGPRGGHRRGRGGPGGDGHRAGAGHPSGSGQGRMGSREPRPHRMECEWNANGMKLSRYRVWQCCGSCPSAVPA